LSNILTLVYFYIKADDPDQAQNLYAKLFGWKFERPREAMEYFLMGLKILKENPGQEDD
jgi:predicted enzyme related to lactoylglutathione lyase